MNLIKNNPITSGICFLLIIGLTISIVTIIFSITKKNKQIKIQTEVQQSYEKYQETLTEFIRKFFWNNEFRFCAIYNINQQITKENYKFLNEFNYDQCVDQKLKSLYTKYYKITYDANTTFTLNELYENSAILVKSQAFKTLEYGKPYRDLYNLIQTIAGNTHSLITLNNVKPEFYNPKSKDPFEISRSNVVKLCSEYSKLLNAQQQNTDIINSELLYSGNKFKNFFSCSCA